MRLARQPPPETLAIFTGARGMGKSHRLERWGADILRFPIWDPKGEHQRWLGGPRWSSAEFLARAEAGELSRGVLRPSVGPTLGASMPDVDLEDDFDLFCRACWRAGALCAGVEEGTLTGADAGYCPPSFATIVNVGRGVRALSAVWVSQRPAQIPMLVRAQASEWWAFGQTTRADSDAVADTLDPDRLADPPADVRALPKYHALFWRRGETFQRIGPR